jgi:hypothetical protein
MGAVMGSGTGIFVVTKFIYLRIGKKFWDLLTIRSESVNRSGFHGFIARIAGILKISCKNVLAVFVRPWSLNAAWSTVMVV